MGRLRSTSTTIVLFEAAPGAHGDHVDSYEWFEDENVDTGSVFSVVSAEIAVDRHSGGVANYLFADNHVEAIAVEQIRHNCATGSVNENFALPIH